MLLAALGIHGVVSYGVAERTREFGIRMALGSTPAQVRRLVMLEGVRVTAAGLGMNDPRVDPWLSGKMAAGLQAATTSGKPILLRVDYEGGHAGVGGTEQQYEEVLADIYSFLRWQLGGPGL